MTHKVIIAFSPSHREEPPFVSTGMPSCMCCQPATIIKGWFKVCTSTPNMLTDMSAEEYSSTEYCKQKNSAGDLGLDKLITTGTEPKNCFIIVIKETTSHIQHNNSIYHKSYEVEQTLHQPVHSDKYHRANHSNHHTQVEILERRQSNFIVDSLKLSAHLPAGTGRKCRQDQDCWRLLATWSSWYNCKFRSG